MPWFAWVLTVLMTVNAAAALADEKVDIGARLVALFINVSLLSAVIVLGTHYVP
jgi:hypothetical protein